MTPHGGDWSEASLAENPAIEHLQKLGWTYVEPSVLDAERPSLKQAVLQTRFLAAIQKLNPWLGPDDAERAAKAITAVDAVTLAEANETIYNRLVHGWSLKAEGDDPGFSRTVRFLDFDDVQNNELVVTRQYRVMGVKKEARPDIVLFVNGLPLVVIECKSPTVAEKWRAEAIKQLRRYQEADDDFRALGAPQLFETVQLVVGTCAEAACYGTVGTPSRFFFEWKDAYPETLDALESRLGTKPKAQDVLIAGLLRPESFLDVVQNFVVFDTENGRTIKKVPRYKQFVAVNRALDRVQNAPGPDERGGVVWHTQGSGKSLTMLWLALKLRRHPRLDNPGLVIVTDRTDLDVQISDTFRTCGFDVVRADSVEDLRAQLRTLGGKTVTTTIQKFQDASGPEPESGRRQKTEVHPVLSEADNVFVMVDEAHRSQYGGLAANLRHALPNACLFGFTGTPIDKKDRSTLQTFGPYIDKYTIEQAVADGATVPIFYESRLPDVSIAGSNLDALFDAYFADRTDEERAAIKKRYATEAAVAAAPRRIETICLDIIQHYRSAILPNGFKAQVVCASREVAVQYKETLDRLNAPESALILSLQHNDEERLVKATPSEDKQRQYIDAFKEPGKGPYLLIVCDKLLTGFDAPIEQVIYLDKPLKEHTLLQAIARTNRRAEGKTYGLIVDYWGVSTDLQDALSVFMSTDVQGSMLPKMSELPRLQMRHAAAMRFFQKVADKEDLNACVEILEPEDVREGFNQAFRSFSKSMDMVLPDRVALPYQDDLKWLGKIRAAAKARFRDDQLDLSGCGAKVRALIENAVTADGIQILVKEVSLFSKEFEEKLDRLKTDEAKASEMEHAIKHEIHVHLDQNPAFYESLRERLEALLQKRREERITSAQLLLEFQKLRKEAEEPHKAAEGLGLDETAFAIYGVLQKSGASVVGEGDVQKSLATVIGEQVRQYTGIVDWHRKEHLQKEMRSDIKKALREHRVGAKEAGDLAREVVDLAKARFRS
ncbi:MAG: type I restriction endonuclease subunit R [Myxococcota bacterium]